MREQYDPLLSFSLAVHAIDIYELSNGYDRRSRARGFLGADVIERGATQIGIAYSADRIVIAARGSSQASDWIDNFLPMRFAWPPVVEGRIHWGFKLQASRVADEVLATVRDLRIAYPDAHVYITGHSLGGALAALLRCVLAEALIPVAAVYTFESPRVGNGVWARWYDSMFGENTFRVVNINAGEQDVVTRVPLSCLGWRHVGRPAILCEGRAYESEAMWEEHRRKNPIGILSHLRIVRRAWLGIAAHLGQSLLRELRAQAGQQA